MILKTDKILGCIQSLDITEWPLIHQSDTSYTNPEVGSW